MLDSVIREGCLLVVIFSGIPLAVSTLAGLFVALIQTATQIQEQSIVYVVKLSAFIVALGALWGWMSSEMVNFLRQALEFLPFIGHGSA